MSKRNQKLKELKTKRKYKKSKRKGKYITLRRSSVTGRFVSYEYVRMFPDLSVEETRRVK